MEADLRALVRETDPELVIATGDLTHRNRAAEQERAAALLRSLERPLVVVPGNHDIPPWSPARFTRTFTAFQRRWPELQPVYRSERVVVCGLNSVTPWKHQGGTLTRGQLEHAARVLADAPAGALKVVALHHHLIGAPWRSYKRPVARRASVLGALVDAGAELILSGHVHQSAAGERREFEVMAGLGSRNDGRHRPRPGPAAPEQARRGSRPPPRRSGGASAPRPHVRLGRPSLGADRRPPLSARRRAAQRDRLSGSAARIPLTER